MDALERCTHEAAVALHKLFDAAGINDRRMVTHQLSPTEDALWHAIFASIQQIGAVELLVKLLQQERLKDQTTDAVEIRR